MGATISLGGALLLLTQRDVGAAHPAYWGLVLFYVIGAAFFSYLMFFSSGLNRR